MFLNCGHKLCFFWANDLFKPHHVILIHTTKITSFKDQFSPYLRKKSGLPNVYKKNFIIYTTSSQPFSKWIKVKLKKLCPLYFEFKIHVCCFFLFSWSRLIFSKTVVKIDTIILLTILLILLVKTCLLKPIQFSLSQYWI
jgi:hypothetical protein